MSSTLPSNPRARAGWIAASLCLLFGLVNPADAASDSSRSAVAVTQRLLAPSGSWTGPVWGDTSRYRVIVRFSTRDGEPFAAVRYTRLNCSGVWSYRGRRGTELRFRERIRRDPGRNCVSTVPVFVYDLQGRRLLVQYANLSGYVRAIVRPR